MCTKKMALRRAVETPFSFTAADRSSAVEALQGADLGRADDNRAATGLKIRTRFFQVLPHARHDRVVGLSRRGFGKSRALLRQLGGGKLALL